MQSNMAESTRYEFTMDSNNEQSSNKEATGDVSEIEKLQKREEERQAKIQKRKESEKQNFTVRESVQMFSDSFSSEQKVLEDLLAQSSTILRSELINHFDQLSQRATKLQRYVSESALFLPSYELKTAQNILVSLQSKIQEKRDELIPKKKFAFKSSRKVCKAGATPVVGNEIEVEDIRKENKDSNVVLADCKFVSRSDSTLRMDNSEIKGKDIALEKLTNCKVYLYGAPSAIHINKLTKCKVFCGPVSGSIFIRECIDCVFVVAAQQLRIHSSLDCKFYIHCTSKAIVEDCQKAGFAPYNLDYPNIDEHFQMSGLSKIHNNWQDIDDFNWLASDMPSPNWYILDPEDRVIQWED